MGILLPAFRFKESLLSKSMGMLLPDFRFNEYFIPWCFQIQQVFDSLFQNSMIIALPAFRFNEYFIPCFQRADEYFAHFYLWVFYFFSDSEYFTLCLT